MAVPGRSSRGWATGRMRFRMAWRLWITCRPGTWGMRWRGARYACSLKSFFWKILWWTIISPWRAACWPAGYWAIRCWSGRTRSSFSAGCGATRRWSWRCFAPWDCRPAGSRATMRAICCAPSRRRSASAGVPGCLSAWMTWISCWADPAWPRFIIQSCGARIHMKAYASWSTR